jgi:hypothetical protein
MLLNKFPVSMRIWAGDILSFFLSIDRSTAQGRYEQFYLNVDGLTEHAPHPAKINFKDAIRSD